MVASMCEETYVRLYMGMSLASARAPSDAVQPGVAGQHAQKWWQQRAPIATRSKDTRIPQLTTDTTVAKLNEQLKEYFSPSSFCYQDCIRGRGQVEAPLAVLAQLLGRAWIPFPPPGVSQRELVLWRRTISKHCGLVRTRSRAQKRRRNRVLARRVLRLVQCALSALTRRTATHEGASVYFHETTCTPVKRTELDARCVATGSGPEAAEGLSTLEIVVKHSGVHFQECVHECVCEGAGWADNGNGDAVWQVVLLTPLAHILSCTVLCATHVDNLALLAARAHCLSGILSVGRNTVHNNMGFVRAVDVATASSDNLRCVHRRFYRNLVWFARRLEE